MITPVGLNGVFWSSNPPMVLEKTVESTNQRGAVARIFSSLLRWHAFFRNAPFKTPKAEQGGNNIHIYKDTSNVAVSERATSAKMRYTP